MALLPRLFAGYFFVANKWGSARIIFGLTAWSLLVYFFLCAKS